MKDEEGVEAIGGGVGKVIEKGGEEMFEVLMRRRSGGGLKELQNAYFR